MEENGKRLQELMFSILESNYPKEKTLETLQSLHTSQQQNLPEKERTKALNKFYSITGEIIGDIGKKKMHMRSENEQEYFELTRQVRGKTKHSSGGQKIFLVQDNHREDALENTKNRLAEKNLARKQKHSPSGDRKMTPEELKKATAEADRNAENLLAELGLEETGHVAKEKSKRKKTGSKKRGGR